jgi:hypothetical protein
MASEYHSFSRSEIAPLLPPNVRRILDVARLRHGRKPDILEAGQSAANFSFPRRCLLPDFGDAKAAPGKENRDGTTRSDVALRVRIQEQVAPRVTQVFERILRRRVC